MTRPSAPVRPGLGALYARRFGRMFAGVGEGFAPLGHFLKRTALGFVCDHDYQYSHSRGRRVCDCGASKKV